MTALSLMLALGTESAVAITEPVLSPGEIGHVIVVMMENRSFDHLLGWYGPADGEQNQAYQYSDGTPENTWRLGPDDYQGCTHPDPAHCYEGGRVEYNNGACDGWLFDETARCSSAMQPNDEYAVGYYTDEDLDFMAGAATSWTVCDNYFSAIMAGTWPNKIFQLAANTDRVGSVTPYPLVSSLPTIFDRLYDAELEARYYYSDAPFVGLWGPKYVSISHRLPQFFIDAESGSLAHVSFIDPTFLGAQGGVSCDDHPYADMRCGEHFLNRIYEAVIDSPNWENTVLIINYDEWGGFFDHVVPTVPMCRCDSYPAPLCPSSPECPCDSDPDSNPCDEDPNACDTPSSTMVPCIPPEQWAGGDTGTDEGPAGLRGFRVPCIVISPWAPRHTVASATYDHTSILRMIGWNWSLAPLTARDANANNLADVLTLSPKDTSAPRFTVFGGPFLGACVPSYVDLPRWVWLCDLARESGFQGACIDIPAVSEWGLFIMTVLLLTAGTVVLVRRRRPAAA